MYITVCDDEVTELNAIDALLHTWEIERNMPLRRRLFQNVGELLEAAQRERFTLYLLDVLMPVTNGMSTAREIRAFDSTADLVFLTSSPEFACESYRVQAPISPAAQGLYGDAV